MKKYDRAGLGKGRTNNEAKNNCRIEQRAEEQNVQERYQSEFMKYQEQINKTKSVALRDDQAA